MLRFLFAAILVGLGTGCGAPRADSIGGDLLADIERGIDNGTKRFDHTRWDELVRQHVRKEGRRFDYAGLKHDEERFDAYLESIATVDLSTLPSTEIQALFVNAYNAYTIATVLEHVSEDGSYAIDSIRDVPDVFTREVHTVGGFSLSLDNMEHNVLRPVFKDPRFHFAVNCASISCPPLPTRAFTGADLNHQLDRVTEGTLNHPDYVSTTADSLLVTKIMDWYRNDFVDPEFEGSEETLPAFIAKYNDEVRRFMTEREGDVSVEFRDYDWSLNRP